MKRSLSIFIFLSTLVSFLSLYAEGSYKQKYKPTYTDKWPMYIELETKKGNLRDILKLSWQAPIWQDESNMLFSDIRFMMDSIRDREGNFGLGYRHIVRDFSVATDGIVLGAYAFYDRKRSPLKNWFNQLTLGVEALAENYQLHANYYLPQHKEYNAGSELRINSIVPDYSIKNNGAVVGIAASLSTLVFKEVSMKGYDIDIKFKYPLTPKLNFWYGAGRYHFSRGSLKSYGPTALLDLELLESLNTGSRFSFGYEYRKDKKRDTSHYAVLKITMPFSNLGIGDDLPGDLKGIDYEMTRFIQRDVDVPSGTLGDEFTASIDHEIDLQIPANTVLSEYSAGKIGIEMANSLKVALESKEQGGSSILIFATSKAGIEEDPISIPESYFQAAIDAISLSSGISDAIKQKYINLLSNNIVPVLNYTAGPVTKTLDGIAMNAIKNNLDDIFAGLPEAFSQDQNAMEDFLKHAQSAINKHGGTLHKDFNPSNIENQLGGFQIMDGTTVDLVYSDLIGTAVVDLEGKVIAPAFINLSESTHVKSYKAQLKLSSQSSKPRFNIDSGELITWNDALSMVIGAPKMHVSIENSANKPVDYGSSFIINRQSEQGEDGVSTGVKNFSYVEILDTGHQLSFQNTLAGDVPFIKVDVSGGILASLGVFDTGSDGSDPIPLAYNITGSSNLGLDLTILNATPSSSALSSASISIGNIPLDVTGGVVSAPSIEYFTAPLAGGNGLIAGSITDASNRIGELLKFNQASGLGLSASDVLTTLVQNSTSGSSLAHLTTSDISDISQVLESSDADLLSTYNGIQSTDGKVYAFDFLMAKPLTGSTGGTGLDLVLNTAESNIENTSSSLMNLTSAWLENKSEAASVVVEKAFENISVSNPTYRLVLQQIQATKPNNPISSKIDSALAGVNTPDIRGSISNALSMSVELGSSIVIEAFTALGSQDPINGVKVFEMLSGDPLSRDSQNFQNIRSLFLDAVNTNPSDTALNDAKISFMNSLSQ